MRKIDLSGKWLLMDTDTIGHFLKGRGLGYLNYLFKGQLIILEDVEDELTGRQTLQHRTDVLQAIQKGVFTRMSLPTNEVRIQTEYDRLCDTRSAGEAACLALGRYVKDMIVVTNLPCLVRYCQRYGIIFVGTLGLLQIAQHEKVVGNAEIADFIRHVQLQGGRLSGTLF
jgi:predicted nucleic acid-binding protein